MFRNRYLTVIQRTIFRNILNKHPYRFFSVDNEKNNIHKEIKLRQLCTTESLKAAIKNFNQHKFEKALPTFNAIISASKVNPKLLPLALYYKAEFLSCGSSKESSEAKKLLARAIKLNPGFGKARRLLLSMEADELAYQIPSPTSKKS